MTIKKYLEMNKNSTKDVIVKFMGVQILIGTPSELYLVLTNNFLDFEVEKEVERKVVNEIYVKGQ